MARLRSTIDADGFRANVAIVLYNDEHRLFWAKRVGMDAWQFPQGGIRPHESIEAAMYRELYEEVGLLPEHVKLVGANAQLVALQAAEEIYPAPRQAALYRPETTLVPAETDRR